MILAAFVAALTVALPTDLTTRTAFAQEAKQPEKSKSAKPQPSKPKDG